MTRHCLNSDVRRRSASRDLHPPHIPEEATEIHKALTSLDPDGLGRFLSPDQLQSEYGDRLVSALSAREPNAFTLLERGQVVGVIKWSFLDWDTEVLEYPCARIDMLMCLGDRVRRVESTRTLLKQCSTAAAQVGVRYLSIRIPAESLPEAHALQGEGFLLVDCVQSLVRSLHDGSAIDGAGVADVYPLQPQQAESVVEVARSAFRFDRFHSDPVFTSEQADRLHAAWARSCCEGIAADTVLVAQHGNKIQGFLSFKWEAHDPAIGGQRLATIVLLATAPGHTSRGIGSQLINRCLLSIRQQNADAVRVGTQIQNSRALRLYQKCGFRSVTSSFTFRKKLTA